MISSYIKYSLLLGLLFLYLLTIPSCSFENKESKKTVNIKNKLSEVLTTDNFTIRDSVSLFPLKFKCYSIYIAQKGMTHSLMVFFSKENNDIFITDIKNNSLAFRYNPDQGLNIYPKVSTDLGGINYFLNKSPDITHELNYKILDSIALMFFISKDHIDRELALSMKVKDTSELRMDVIDYVNNGFEINDRLDFVTLKMLNRFSKEELINIFYTLLYLKFEENIIYYDGYNFDIMEIKKYNIDKNFMEDNTQYTGNYISLQLISY